MPKISVIMLTYNRENFVARAIESVLQQDFKEFEFIIVDNGSTDSSGKIADEYAAKDSRVHVIHREKGNIGSGRNAGLDVAIGDYIAFVDDDDIVDSDFLEFLLKLANTNAADISICGFQTEDRKFIPHESFNQKFIMTPKEAIITLMRRKLFNNGFPTKLIAKKIFSKLRFPENERYDDIFLMYKILANANKVVLHTVPKYQVTRHESNNSLATKKDNMITPEYIADYRKAYRQRTEWLCNRYPNEIGYWLYFDWSFQISMVNKIITNQLINCHQALTEMKKELFEHKQEFLASPHLLEFEKKWMEEYII